MKHSELKLPERVWKCCGRPLDYNSQTQCPICSDLSPYRFSFTSGDERHIWIRFYRYGIEAALEDCKKVARRENPDAHGFLIESDQDDIEVRKSWGLDK